MFTSLPAAYTSVQVLCWVFILGLGLQKKKKADTSVHCYRNGSEFMSNEANV